MPDWLLQLLPQAALAASVYAGIRADLARLNERASHALESARAAHARIDNLKG
ncbi:hypothetical protein [Roseateles microcysteis]|uniref:hypothetical protein n=1 Tax=Roseateles microcysteis TaxID=3119057 RepID=UPI002FE597D9